MSTAGDSGASGPSGPVDRQLTPRNPRKKRSQVVRACNACRIHRIKCDNNRPCSNCKTRSRHCSNNDATKASTLSEAYEEIAHLRQKVQNLEGELQQERSKTGDVYQNILTPPDFSPSHLFQAGSVDREHGDSKKKYWEGIELRPARSPHETWFGPSSLYYFIKRLSVCLSSSLQQNLSADNMLFNPVSSRKLLDGPNAANEEDSSRRVAPSTEDSSSIETYLSPTQEEYFISLFWHSYHTSLSVILDETEFKSHHQSLWMTSGNVRKPSALVDIVLAMCMQYGISTLPAGTQGSIAESNDATIAGRWHYRRCQKLLAYETESPTIATLQCHLLCAVYVCGGSFHNMVDTFCGLAVRTAYMLGLHLDPPKTMPEREREKRRRLWWAVYVLDSKTNMKLGRPFMTHDSYAMPQLPRDNNEVAMMSGSTFVPLGNNTTWLSFSLHDTKLYMAIRAAHTAFYNKELDLRDGQTIWDDSRALEGCAELMLPYTKNLEDWVRNVPVALKTKRQNDGQPLSTDGSMLEIEQFAPLWLQGQRLVLELTYHHLCISVYRPFISLVSASTPGALAEEAAVKCAAHAIALTNITHQVLSSTSILDGRHEVFQYQWSTAMTLVGFVLTYPHGELTSAARSAIDVSVSVFDIFGKSFGVAAGAASIVRDLCIKVDFLVGQAKGRPGVLGRHDEASGKTALVAGFTGPAEQSAVADSEYSMANLNIDPGFYDMTDAPNQDLFDMALGVDFWGDFDTLWPSTGSFPDWSNMQL